MRDYCANTVVSICLGILLDGFDYSGGVSTGFWIGEVKLNFLASVYSVLKDGGNIFENIFSVVYLGNLSEFFWTI